MEKQRPTIDKLEKMIGTPSEPDILPNGSVQPKYPNLQNKHPKKPKIHTMVEILELDKYKSLVDRILRGEFCGNKTCPANVMNLAKATVEGKKLGKCQGHQGHCEGT